VVGRSGEIAALSSATRCSRHGQDARNKILWVSRRTVKPGPDDLRITAQRMRGRRPVGRHVVRLVRGGPGPSYVDPPTRGCWRLTLRWSGRTDQLTSTTSTDARAVDPP